MNRSGTESEPSGVRLEAYRILRRVEEAGAYASVLLDGVLPRFPDSRDRALLHEIVLGVLRRRSLIDHVLRQAASRPPERQDPAILTALRIGAYALLFLDRVPDFAAVDTAVETMKRDGHASAAGFVNGVLRRIARDRRALVPPPPANGETANLARSEGHPEWWTARMVAGLGWDGAVRLLRANNEPAAVVLRVNASRSTAGDLVTELRAEGIGAEPTAHVPGALVVREGTPHTTRAFRRGAFYIQDEGSQMVPWLFGDDPGRRVLDLCAAPGGKTFHLAERLAPGSLLVAVDRHPGRLRRLRANAGRLGHGEVLVAAADLAAERSCLGTTFDAVLLDAPCSGSGTFRRHPELRWRLKEKDVGRLSARQSQLLDRAARRVAPGGRLVYSVCSMEPEEGEAVIRRFLNRNHDFRLSDPGAGFPEACRRFLVADGMLRTSPADGGMDGFFAALLVHGGDPA